MLKKIALYGFIAYFSLFLVFFQPVKVSANPALGGIIISQLARTGLQKASQQVGIAVATRAGVRISTSAAAKAAHARWFQTSAHAASTAMTSSTKVAGQGTVSGWLKVLMGGMLADSLITNTKNMYTSISNLINSLGGVPVAEGSEMSNTVIANEVTSIPAAKTWLKADFVSEEQCFLEWREYWSCLVPGLNRSAEKIYTGKYGSGVQRSVSANTDFLYCPVGETILVNYTDYISYVSVSGPEIIFGADENTTKVKAEFLSVNISTGEVVRSEEVLTALSNGASAIAPIYGIISINNSNSNFAAFTEKNYTSSYHLYKPSGHTFIANPISLDFILRTVTLAADSVTVSEPAPASSISPLVIQVPDLKAIAAANPTATEDEIHDIALNMILENPEIVSGAESCTYTEGEIEAMPEYFSPEYHVSDPDPDPDPDPDLGFDFSGILGFLQSILDAISSIVNYLNPFSEDFFLYIAFVPQTEAISTSVAALQAQAEITFAFIFDIRDILLGVMSGTFTDEEWEGLWIRGHWLVGDVCVVSPVPTNTWAPDIKFWIGGFVVFLTMLVTIKRIRNFMSA
jgi:hypothetical protein